MTPKARKSVKYAYVVRQPKLIEDSVLDRFMPSHLCNTH